MKNLTEAEQVAMVRALNKRERNMREDAHVQHEAFGPAALFEGLAEADEVKELRLKLVDEWVHGASIS